MIIYFDENFPYQLAQALNILDKNNDIYSTSEKYKGFKDNDLIPKLGKENAVLITRDKKMRKLNAEKELLRNNNMIVMFYDGSHNDYWSIVKLFVKVWDKITHELFRVNKGPCFFKLNVNGKIERL